MQIDVSCSQPSSWDADLRMLRTLTHTMSPSVSPQQSVNLIEDKDPNIAWQAEALPMAFRWLRQLLQTPGRWELRKADMNQVLRFYRVHLDVALPRRL